MSEFKIKPTGSKIKLAKQVIDAIENELKTCNPNYELTIDIKIIENRNKLIPDIINKRKWGKLFKSN